MAATPEGEVFTVHCTGSLTKKVWDGKFTARALLSFRQQMGADRMKRELLGPDVQYADSDVVAEASMVSELAFRLTSWPEWWAANGMGSDLHDPNLLLEVYNGAKAIETKYFEGLKVDAEAAKKVVVEEKDKPQK